jgi:phytoene synthase
MTDASEPVTEAVRAHDRERYIASLFAPELARGGLMTLAAYQLELARVREAVSEPLPGEIRLQWWRDVIEGRVEAGGHPVAAALIAAIERFSLPRPPLAAMSEAWIFDLYDDPMPTLADLEGYAGGSRAALIQLGARVLAVGEEPRSATAAGHAGVAQTIAAVLTALPRHAARGQVYLPADLLERHGASAEDIRARRATPPLAAALAELVGHARTHLERARTALPGIDPRAAAAFLPALAADRLLAGALARRHDPFRPVAGPPGWRTQLDIWREARRLRRMLAG